MMESNPAVRKDHTEAIAHLCEEFRLPKDAVTQVFEREFDRLVTGARIATYVPVLAMRHTRLTLHTDGRRASHR